MRCLKIIGVLLFSYQFAMVGKAQDTISPVNRNLPGEALKSRYRIHVKDLPNDQLETMQKFAKEFNAKYRMNTYVIRRNELFQLVAGDFREKKVARQRLSHIKKTYKKAGVVRSDNDSIFIFYIVERKKPAKVNTVTASPVTKPDIKTESEALDNTLSDSPVNIPSVWVDIKYPEANTAVNEDYLTAEEKLIYYYLNLVRINPKLFADTYLGHLRNSDDSYESSLYEELQWLQPLPVLKPNRKLFESAKCHAVESGLSGYVGHTRGKCSRYFMGECCQYGLSGALEIVTALLIDQDIPSLGHRKICLGSYTELGVSIQPHRSYRVNAVLDFY
ncbi:MAG: hypothetical protein AB9834_12870 [Lentimicrobium sp.]